MASTPQKADFGRMEIALLCLVVVLGMVAFGGLALLLLVLVKHNATASTIDVFGEALCSLVTLILAVSMIIYGRTDGAPPPRVVGARYAPADSSHALRAMAAAGYTPAEAEDRLAALRALDEA